MRERKYRMKARLMSGTTLVGYQLISPNEEIVNVSLAEAAQFARGNLINNVKLGSDGKLKSNGIMISRLPIKQVGYSAGATVRKYPSYR